MVSRIRHIQPDLALALTDLSELLVKLKVHIHLRVIGAFALQLLGIDSTYTVDIDVIDDIESSIRQLIAEVGKAHKLAVDWINDSAGDLDLPEGFSSRMATVTLYPSIVVSFPCRQDMISLKARAFIHRGAKNPASSTGPKDLKDLDDLTKLGPTEAEIELAIEFIRQTASPPEPQFFPDFDEFIEVLRHVAR